MPYPLHRFRRLRRTAAIRDLVAEVSLHPGQLVQPILIGDQPHFRESILESRIVQKLSIDFALKEIEGLLEQGIKTVYLQAFPDERDMEGTAAWTPEGLMQVAIKAVKDEFDADCTILSEVTLRHATLHQVEGIVIDGELINDPTAELIAKAATAQAEAGSDFVCPTDMMDGRILYTREALDDSGYEEVGIFANAVKYASAFSRALEPVSPGVTLDPGEYQVDRRNSNESLLEMASDLEEGADMLLLQPAHLCLDVVTMAQGLIQQPISVYQTATEAAMIELATNKGWLDEEQAVLDTFYSYRRAGAAFIISFYSRAATYWI